MAQCCLLSLLLLCMRTQGDGQRGSGQRYIVVVSGAAADMWLCLLADVQGCFITSLHYCKCTNWQGDGRRGHIHCAGLKC